MFIIYIYYYTRDFLFVKHNFLFFFAFSCLCENAQNGILLLMKVMQNAQPGYILCKTDFHFAPIDRAWQLRILKIFFKQRIPKNFFKETKT